MNTTTNGPVYTQEQIQTPQGALQAIYDAFNTGDVDLLLELYDDAAVLITKAGAVTSGRAALREMLSEFFANGFEPHLIEDGDHYWVVTDNIAKAVGRYIINGKNPDGSPKQVTGTEIVVLRKQDDGRWLLLMENTYHDELLASVAAA